MSRLRRSVAFSLIEVAVAIGIVAILGSIGLSSYVSYLERARVVSAISDIRNIAVQLDDWELTSGRFPDSLAEVDADDWLDPWGLPYVFHDLEGGGPGPARGEARKDQFLVPISSDYDLYSKGKDGASVASLQSPTSLDDVVRAQNGSFIGLARNF